jgi:hypothetical protein
MLSNIKNRFTNFLARVKRVFTEVETFVKTAAITVIGGGVNAAIHGLHDAGAFAWDIEHLAALKASFFGGMFTAFIFYLFEFPKLKKLTDASGAKLGMVLLLCGLSLASAMPMHAQTLADAPAPKSVEAHAHNFFWDKFNTPLLLGQAGGAVLAAKEWNGVLSYYIPDTHELNSQLQHSYEKTFAIMAGVDGLAYGFHKAHFRGHHVLERLTMLAGAGGLYWNGVRNKHAYDKSDCDRGREEGDGFLVSHFCY